MQGIHFSSNDINIGELIRSEQSLSGSFKLYHAIYKRVADKLGVYYPEDFGYAYPLDKDLKSFNSAYRRKPYLVEAPDAMVTRGNRNASIFYVIGLQIPRELRHIQNLDERTQERDRIIERYARMYFDVEHIDIDDVELISDQFIVQKVVEL